MKVQPINEFVYYKLKMQATEQQESQAPVASKYNSIYSKGMSCLTFGSVVPLKTAFAKEIAEQPKVLKSIIDKFFHESGKISGIDINWSKDDIAKASAINIVASGSSSEYMHGLFTSIKPEDVFIEVAPDGNARELAVQNFMEIVKKRNVQNPILLKTETNKSIEENLKNIDFIDIPETVEEFAPLLSTVRFQQLTNGITKKLGINPDNGGGVLTKYRANLSM